jgi:hypothetical protein
MKTLKIREGQYKQIIGRNVHIVDQIEKDSGFCVLEKQRRTYV